MWPEDMPMAFPPEEFYAEYINDNDQLEIF